MRRPRRAGETKTGQSMNYRSAVGAAAVVAALMMTSMARAFDDAKYPDLSGQWVAVRLGVRGQPAFDPTKPWGLGQQAPLTPAYQKVLEASVAEQAKGNQGNWLSGVSCLPTGMPAMMTLYRPMEIVVLPEITYVRIDHTHQSHRRIYTDGRAWPKEFPPSFHRQMDRYRRRRQGRRAGGRDALLERPAGLGPGRHADP
jgi:hypothetical protein